MSAIGAIGSYGSVSGYYSIYQNRNAWQNRNATPSGTEAVSPVSRAQTTPVPPVNETPAVHRGAVQNVPEENPFRFPTMRDGADPAEMAVRARIQYLDGRAEDLENEPLGWDQSKGLERLQNGSGESRDLGKLLNKGQEGLTIGQEEAKSPQEVVEESECQTCKSRKYQDGSDDPGVSFKTATNIAPEQAASAVRGHEQEHVVRERAAAQREDRKVVSQSVTIHTAICPECGDVYVSGGTTRTATKANPVEEPKQAEDEKKSGFEAVV
ncbi:MAG: hypothetical protein HFF52_06030 [Lawsonibacter sp.]|nr:hypothetical protein [Lawsonibacter sp.]